ncbi:MAG: anti-sigma factor [Pseudomonadota bacterium]
MEIHRNPELVERLAAAYALGSLRGGARRRFESLARMHPSVRAVVLIWQSRLMTLTELQAPVRPAPTVWTRIDNLIRAEREQASMDALRKAGRRTTGSWWNSLPLWRGASAAGAVATALMVAATLALQHELNTDNDRLLAQQTVTPELRYVAVLSDPQARAAVWVSFDSAQQRLRLQRVGSYEEGADQSLQLWALPPSGAPRSLGVLTKQPVQQLTASEAELSGATALAISLEPLGGVPSERGPTGPVLFTGTLIKNML